MKKRNLILGSLLVGLLLTGCGEVQPGLADAVKGSYQITNGMTMDEVKKVMVVEPTGQEKIGDNVIWRYEGNTYKGEDETLVVKFNNIIIKFVKGVVTHSGTFSCDLPKVRED